jgi:hypothetical protein
MGASHKWVVGKPFTHTIEVQHATHRGRVKITVDGRPVFEQNDPEALWDTGFDETFLVDGVPCRIRIGGASQYQLWINGRLYNP